jgi:hypothetical protein
MSDIQIINPITHPGWNNLILSHPDYSFFHSSAWAKVLNEAYGYKLLYFTVLKNGSLSALIPIMEVNSFLTGRRGVSLPFTDYCEPIINDGVKFQDLMNLITEYGEKAGWKYIEFRGGKDLLPFSSPSCTYIGHTLDLTRGEEYLYSNFRDSTGRNIRKASGEGVKTTLYSSLESIREFYRLNCMTRREHGLPPQSYLFFEKLHNHIISKSLGHVILASYKNWNIAGAIFFHFGKQAFYKYGASDKSFQHLRPNNLIMWEAIKWYSQNGYKSLCYGRTEPENQGLIQFKSGWGTTEQRINYYRYDMKRGSFVSGFPKVTGFHNKIFRNLPLPILNLVGALLYKHAG